MDMGFKLDEQQTRYSKNASVQLAVWRNGGSNPAETEVGY